MTSFSENISKLQIKEVKVPSWVVHANTAVGEDSKRVIDEYKRTIEHYFVPISRQWADPPRRFLSLKIQWESGTAFLSSITEIVLHPAYQQIIGMGPIAIPMILSEMQKKPNHWFWALKAITGDDPVPPNQRGRLREMTATWLLWGKKQGYIL